MIFVIRDLCRAFVPRPLHCKTKKKQSRQWAICPATWSLGAPRLMMTPSRISPPDTGHMPDLLPSRRTHLACRRRCPVPSQESQGACPQKKKKNDIVARAAGLGRPEGRDREPFENVPRGRLPAASASASVGAPQTPRHATPHVRSAARGRGGGTRKRPANGGTARCGGRRRPSLLRTTAVPALLCW